MSDRSEHRHTDNPPGWLGGWDFGPLSYARMVTEGSNPATSRILVFVIPFTRTRASLQLQLLVFRHA